MFYQIAIDGVSGSGKTTIAKLLAKKLDFLNINTGIFFRALTFYQITHNIETDEELLKNISDLKFNSNKAYIGNQDITPQLFSHQVTSLVSKMSESKIIRNHVLRLERKCITNKNIIMEGRDIGSVVLPNATIKIFLNASIEARAKRRFEQIQHSSDQQNVSLKDITTSIEHRDHLDKNRKLAPLIKTSDAIEISSDDKTIEEIVNYIAKIFYKKIGASSIL